MSENNERPFNMALAFLERLDRRLDESQKASSEANLILWYRILRTIYRQIHFKIKLNLANEKDIDHKKEIEEIEGLFSKARIQLGSNVNTRNNQINREIASISLTNTEVILDELEIKLNDLLYKYELSYPEAYTPPTFEEKLEDSY